jgi:uncharacterized protein YqeY
MGGGKPPAIPLRSKGVPLPCGVHMNFQDRIDQDIKEAMKARQADRLGVLRMLKSALKNAAIEAGGAEARLDDAASQVIVRKEVKRRQDAVEGFEKGGRPELAAKERDEAALLNTYLPQQLSPTELEVLVVACVAEAGATSKAQMGAVMKLAVERAAGRADGRALSTAISAKLA